MCLDMHVGYVCMHNPFPVRSPRVAARCKLPFALGTCMQDLVYIIYLRDRIGRPQN